MKVNGYMLEVEYDGHTLTAQGTTKASQVALRGQQHNDGPLILQRADIATVDVRAATRLTNGRVTLHTAGGAKYVLHFRRKQADAFAQLALALRD